MAHHSITHILGDLSRRPEKPGTDLYFAHPAKCDRLCAQGYRDSGAMNACAKSVYAKEKERQKTVSQNQVVYGRIPVAKETHRHWEHFCSSAQQAIPQV